MCLCRPIIPINLLWYYGDELLSVQPAALHLLPMFQSSLAVFSGMVLRAERSRAQPRSVFTASPSESLGLMVLLSWVRHFSSEMGLSPGFWSFSISVASTTIVPQLSPAPPLSPPPWPGSHISFQVTEIGEYSFTRLPSLVMWLFSLMFPILLHILLCVQAICLCKHLPVYFESPTLSYTDMINVTCKYKNTFALTTNWLGVSEYMNHCGDGK